MYDPKNAWIGFDEYHEIVIEACLKCVKEFQENIKWLHEMLKNGKFYRTALFLPAPNF